MSEIAGEGGEEDNKMVYFYSSVALTFFYFLLGQEKRHGSGQKS